MNKLIASDIDGTLLQHGQQHISESFIKVIKELKKIGVTFVAASGRQLPSLRTLFKDVLDDIYIVAENGAIASYKNEIIFEKTMSPSLAHEIVTDIMRTPGCDPIISTKETVYISKKANDFFRETHRELIYTTTVTDDFYSIRNGVLKVTACNYDGIRNDVKAFADSWKKFAEVTMSGFMYCDFMDLSVSKGNALEKIQNILDLKPEECIAFGDNFNDISMFDKVESSFAMVRADDKVKEYARYQTENVEDTVRKIYNITS
ncbi:MAG: HAD family hydrolase [Clostridiales bacterium]|nr:HAD family hydrolase [Clostridiales bacterium]MBS5877683.1 HAD family hydrolase [Clostridiales bacterium]MDU0940108.1 HAD family hydrolase [Clostridiales bacterium]MDU1042513.1 HAD family hydrolase [Clostridiales bacterium]MDU3490645.1 HAD family hydrolase [Clostridiales bacterium]